MVWFPRKVEWSLLHRKLRLPNHSGCSPEKMISRLSEPEQLQNAVMCGCFLAFHDIIIQYGVKLNEYIYDNGSSKNHWYTS